MAKKAKKKNRISALLLLLFITVVMLGTATFAWFTSNRTVTIDDIEINVVAASGLQISTDATTWKTVISTEDITDNAYSGNLNQVPVGATSALVPVSTDGTVASTGLMNMFTGSVAADDSGVFKLTATQDTEAAGSDGHFVAFDIFLKLDNIDTSSSKASIYLTKDSGVIASDLKTGDTTYGLEYASRVAFVEEGHILSSADPSTVVGLREGTTSVIWEPNADMHTQAGINNAKTNYSSITGVSSLVAATSSAKLPYDGVKAEISEENAVALNDTSATAHNKLFGAVTTVGTNASRDSGTEIFGLDSGITKVRVYFWVEGQDVDCENNASGHKITLQLALSLDEDGNRAVTTE